MIQRSYDDHTVSATQRTSEAEPPGLEPELSDISLWRHLLRGTHGFSLHGPEPVSLFPEAPELARTRSGGLER